MSIEDLNSLNFERMISFSYDPLKGAMEHIIKILDHHNALLKRLEDNSSIFESTDSEEEEKNKAQQAKHERIMLEPIYKKLNQLEKMITDQNKEMSQMQRQNRNLNYFPTPKQGQTPSTVGMKLSQNLKHSNNEDFTLFLQKMTNEIREIESNNMIQPTNLALENITEEQAEASQLSSFQLDYRMQHILFQLRSDIYENIYKKIDQLDKKCSNSFSKITSMLDSEFGIVLDNEIVLEEDMNSVSSANSQSQHNETYHQSTKKLTSEVTMEQEADQQSTHNPNMININGLEGNTQNFVSSQNKLNTLNPYSTQDNNQNRRKSVMAIERISNTQKQFNDLTSKIESLNRSTQKLNDYYDTNNLRINSVQEMANQIESLTNLVDQKATSLDVKKLSSRMNEAEERLDQRESKNELYEKQFRDLENLINNVQRQNNHKFQSNEQKMEIFTNEFIEVKKDIEIKFGSKNLLSFGTSGSPDGGQNELIEQVKEMIEVKFALTLQNMDQYKTQITQLQQSFEGQLAHKVDKKLLEDTHEKFSVQLEKFVTTINKRFMDKAETKKTFKMFEKQLKNIFDIIITKFEEQDLSDAMISKKPLGGWSCISCQKKVSNIAGAIAEYQVTGQFPYRDPQDRLNNVGAGFSKMLSSMRPETTKSSLRPFSKLANSASQQNIRTSAVTAQSSAMNKASDDLPKSRGVQRKDAHENHSQKRLGSPEDYTSDEGGLIQSQGAKYTPINSLQMTLAGPQLLTPLAHSMIHSRTHGSSLNQDMIQSLKIADSIPNDKKQGIIPPLKIKRPSKQL